MTLGTHHIPGYQRQEPSIAPFIELGDVLSLNKEVRHQQVHFLDSSTCAVVCGSDVKEK